MGDRRRDAEPLRDLLQLQPLKPVQPYRRLHPSRQGPQGRQRQPQFVACRRCRLGIHLVGEDLVDIVGGLNEVTPLKSSATTAIQSEVPHNSIEIGVRAIRSGPCFGSLHTYPGLLHNVFGRGLVPYDRYSIGDKGCAMGLEQLRQIAGDRQFGPSSRQRLSRSATCDWFAPQASSHTDRTRLADFQNPCRRAVCLTLASLG